MLFSYAVRSVYIESCSVFVRGGVYRFVEEAMGSTMAKFSVSALMFDYILTGPISGVSAGEYLAGFLNELLRYAHLSLYLPANLTAAALAVLVTVYFWWMNIKGHSRRQRESSPHHVCDDRHGGVSDGLVRLHRLCARSTPACMAVAAKSGSGEHDLEPDQLFTRMEQWLFTKAPEIAEKNGKTIRLAVVASNDIYDAMVRAAQNLRSSVIVVARSSRLSASEQGRVIGLSWERLPQPKPHLRLEICGLNGQEETFYLGPHRPHLSPKEIDLLHDVWLHLSEKAVPKEVHHHDVVHFALTELEREIAQFGEQDVLRRLREHLSENASSGT
jgi:hypothetical protein